jgi:hypothetical protein
MFDTGNLGDKDNEVPEFKSHTFRFMVKYCPRLVILILKWMHRAETKQAEKLHGVFSQSQRIDLFPAR